MYRTSNHKMPNKERILECIFRNAPISRTAIAQLTGITPATTTHTITELLQDGAVYEIGHEDDTSVTGRKRILLDICPDYRYAIGLEFNQKFFVLCISSLKGTIIYKTIEEYSVDLSQNINKRIIDSISDALLKCHIPQNRFIGIGIAIPAHISKKTGHLVSNHSVWDKFDALMIRDAFSIPVVIENNARCMALSQYLFHPEYAPESFAFFHISQGMFCANIIEGRLFLGTAYVSGEIGHTIVNPHGLRCECGKRGCLQTIASEQRLIQDAKKLYTLDPSSLLHHLISSVDEITIGTIVAAYSLGDEAIISIIANALTYLGISTSNIAILMNPEKIFLHGELVSHPDIRSELIGIINNQLSFVESEQNNGIEILPYLPEDGALGGAALAILECFLQISYDL